MAVVDSQPDPLRAFLWGKRQSRRHAVALPVSLRGTQGRVPAHAVDLSAHGVLLRLTERDLIEAQPDLPPTDSVVLLQTHFRGAFRMLFSSCGVKADGELVRVAIESEADGELLVGARFLRPLSRRKLRRFGLGADACVPESELHVPPSGVLPFELAEGEDLQLELYRSASARKLLYAGRVVGLGDRTLCALLPDADAGEVAARLSARPLAMRVLRNTDEVWRTEARLMVIGFPASERGVELGLVTESDADPALRRAFRRREGAA